ncbi:MAG: low molecular weight phosphotyrosine protein phosphatase [Tannerellaceae bacterium]|jgi:protein-tyrosine phosphatase|nr:low molecular weight phosphotyrosine protein phosphatase [Tannerellaceae bacterium]
MTRILFVCLGNICRSPAAEAILKKQIKDAGLENDITVDSAGLLDYHEGERPDPRMRRHAALRGYVLDSRSRPLKTKDFLDFDRIIGMDHQNIEALHRLAPDAASQCKIQKMTDYDPARPQRYTHVPDPYYGESADFDHVLDILEDTCRELLKTLSAPPCSA